MFANLCNAFLAIGTVGAVIVSLYLILRENNVKYKMSGNTITIMNQLTNDYITPKVLGLGEDFTFLIEKVQINEILQKVTAKRIIIFLEINQIKNIK